MSQTATEPICVKVGTRLLIKEQTYHGDGKVYEVSEITLYFGQGPEGNGVMVFLVPIIDGQRGVVEPHDMKDIAWKIKEGFIVVGTTEKPKIEDPVLVVNCVNAGNFHEECAQLVDQGYKLQSTGCSPGADSIPNYHAIFVHPSAM